MWRLVLSVIKSNSYITGCLWMILHDLKETSKHIVHQLKLFLIRFMCINAKDSADLIQDKTPTKYLYTNWLSQTCNSFLILLNLFVLGHTIHKPFTHLLNILIGIKKLKIGCQIFNYIRFVIEVIDVIIHQ